MKMISAVKNAALLVLVLGLGVGCTTPVEEEPTASYTQADAEQAIADAKAANAEAKAAGAEWRDTADLIAQAEAALADGDYDKAVELANQARRQAENALAQKLAEDARRNAQKADDSYTVQRGDSLWAISGMSNVYADPYMWPLIYKANSNQIEDADLIFPGQNLTIDRNASDADMAAAANHARNRGAWSLGSVESSDRNYLAR